MLSTVLIWNYIFWSRLKYFKEIQLFIIKCIKLTHLQIHSVD